MAKITPGLIPDVVVDIQTLHIEFDNGCTAELRIHSDYIEVIATRFRSFSVVPKFNNIIEIKIDQ